MSTENVALAWLNTWVPGQRNIDSSDLAGLEAVLADEGSRSLELLRKKASAALNDFRGPQVYYRGLLEFSNQCDRDCLYCGIRSSNKGVRRYRMEAGAMVETALWCATNGYGSITLQSGEIKDRALLLELLAVVARIKTESRSDRLPDGLGITLSLGELPEDILSALYAAGAHRYLLRMETSNPVLYAHLHPDAPDWTKRLETLRTLKRIGYQIGSGVMIGLPGQTDQDLAKDLLFLSDEGVHMVGMGPYQPHGSTPLNPAVVQTAKYGDGGSAGKGALPDWAWWDRGIASGRQRFEKSLRMLGLCRLIMPLANIAAATALQALHPFGRERGLDFGANILMPLVTPGNLRADYALYDDKPCADEETEECKACLEGRVKHTKREIAYDQWGDSLVR